MDKQRIRVVSAAIERDGRYLITQRTERAVLPLLWEFPGGRVEDGEDDQSALARELDHRLGVMAAVGQLISTVEREYDRYTVELHLYQCEIGDAQPRARGVKELAWATPAECETYEFTPADQHSMDALLFSKNPENSE